MEAFSITPHITAFIRPEQGANVGLIHSREGYILVDTTSSPAEMGELLNAVQVKPEQVRLVINTHFHSDHTWGNQLFNCPILAQQACRQIMLDNLQNSWSKAALQSYLAGLEQTDTRKAAEFRQVLESLVITPPGQVFDERTLLQSSEGNVEVIHLGGHTADACVVWLPDREVLFASDEIFQGRYPYIFDADIPAWVQVLERLPDFKARVIIPGHGTACGEAEISGLRNYLQETWQCTARHIQQGHTADEAAADPAQPIFPGEKYERLHRANIRQMYKTQAGLPDLPVYP